MSINWDDVRILTSTLSHKIHLAKGKVNPRNPSRFVVSDKSGDKTRECIAAVVTHLLLEGGPDGRAVFEIPGVARLTCEDLSKLEEVES